MHSLYDVAQAYQTAMKGIKDLVKSLPFKVVYIMEELGLERSQFYARLKNENWEPRHLLVFAELEVKAGGPRIGGGQ